ncbi:MAG: 2-amino-4-hydroxy-6-hydroxymethyldihydropteridine diphosphokinase [Methylococcaceae bacterium]|nr:2-amino-4-hydroxy-6-hydroxymethyldihydropteridine diphosphokinase [Methylococcaceae bacterium]
MTPSNPWFEAYIGLGSNLGDPIHTIASARLAIAGLADVEEIAFSPLYGSRPVGPQDQPDYVNAVMRIKTRLSAPNLLKQLQGIENAHGRVRSVRWGARTLDLDILLYDQQLINQPDLIVPHPELPNRAFVLHPLADVADSDLPIPGKGRLAELLTACPADGLKRIAQ